MCVYSDMTWLYIFNMLDADSFPDMWCIFIWFQWAEAPDFGAKAECLCEIGSEAVSLHITSIWTVGMACKYSVLSGLVPFFFIIFFSKMCLSAIFFLKWPIGYGLFVMVPAWKKVSVEYIWIFFNQIQCNGNAVIELIKKVAWLILLKQVIHS